MDQDKAIDYLINIYLSPGAPSSQCIKHPDLAGRLQSHKLKTAGSLLRLAVLRNSTNSTDLRESASSSISDLLMAYPIEQEGYRDRFSVPLRDTVYSKLNEMRALLKSISSEQFETIAGMPRVVEIDLFLDGVTT
mmetsp:Transcript_22682/g.34972  ORF Transcript_22682/g.34972 Transcript_22682/m.34972 type:complete len:135 (+) Transcript_22682:862-1266(+)